MPLKNILNLARPEIRKLQPYQSARLITEQKDIKGKIYLDANENPYLPYPQDKSTRYFNRYPEQQPKELKKILSSIYKVSPENLLITRGSGEAIDILIRAFCEPKKNSIIICPPTFGLYKVYAQINSVNVFSIPLQQDKKYQLNMDSIIKTIQTNSVKLIFIPSPNAPMGHIMQQQDIISLCKNLSDTSLVVIDEAYIEFAERKSITRFLMQYPNLIVLRTLSKDYAMAGLRIGCCIAAPELIVLLRTILAPYPLCIASIMAAVKALSANGLKLARKNITKIINERKKLENKLTKLSCVRKVYRGKANFVLFQVDDSDDVVNYCAKKGIILRSQSSQLTNCVRVSIGTPTENRKLLKVLNGYCCNDKSY
jgi:histidinol-phosphate aminotransferase